MPRMTIHTTTNNINVKNILLQLSSGLGDQIICARYAKYFAQYAPTTVMASRNLVSLISRVDGVTNCIADEENPTETFDTTINMITGIQHIEGFTLPAVSGEAYLTAEPRQLKGTFKVGLRWAGCPIFEHELKRVFDPQYMLDLTTISGPTFYALQRDHSLIDVPFTDLRNDMNTWEDTASILKGLDLVITSDTSVAHCAGALGVETWIVVPTRLRAYYPWVYQDRTPNKTKWYNSVTLFRQETEDNWDKPFVDIRQALIEKIAQL